MMQLTTPAEPVETLGDTTPGAFDPLDMLEHPALAAADDATRIGPAGWALLAAILGAAVLVSDLLPWGWALAVQP